VKQIATEIVPDVHQASFNAAQLLPERLTPTRKQSDYIVNFKQSHNTKGSSGCYV